MFEIFKKLGRKPAEKKGEEKKAKAPKATLLAPVVFSSKA